LPTYTSQTELNFVLSAGQGEFLRFIAAPGDAEESCFLAEFALKISWRYQIPAFLLTDKTLGEGIYNLDIDSMDEVKELPPVLWDKKLPYKRYQNTENGISPLAFAPEKDTIIKINSYEHDESGITTEDPAITVLMQDKRFRKEKYLSEELEKYELVKVYGKKDSDTGILCWGSNKGVCIEVAEKFGLKVIQPLVLHPFPVKQFGEACNGVKKIIAVENNATGQLAGLVKKYGFNVNDKILKYDGRPFSIDELEERVREIT
jgi:2-oxoglutarate ferredoxin oxidoreductase subunit alpha